MDVKQFIIHQNKNIKEAMAIINVNAHGICFIVNDTNELKGILTDGDIRRALLAEKSILSPICEIMKTSYISLPMDVKSDTINAHLNDKIRVIPLVDEKNNPVDFASFSRFHRTPIMQPSLDGNELAYVTDCIKTGWISSQGAYVKRFEREFAEYCGADYALAVSNGTVALHLALVALGIDKGDEVIVPNLTFAASINSIIYTGATPVLIDVDRNNWTISIAEIENNITSKTKAIMPVHLYGHPCAMDEIINLAQKHNLLIIEDAAEALGSKYKGKHVGVFSDAATFSFFGNKTITTGEGGMILFKKQSDYEKAMVLRDHGMSKEKRYWHNEVGFNYRLTNLQAAIGCAQMERIHSFVSSKRELAKRYNYVLTQFNLFELPPQEEWAYCGYWLYTVILKPNNLVTRDELIQKLLKNGIEARPVFFPLHSMPPYIPYIQNNDFKHSNYISDNGISLPSSVNITEVEFENILNSLKQILINFDKGTDLN